MEKDKAWIAFIFLLMVASLFADDLEVARAHRNRYPGKEGYFYYVKGTEEQIKVLSFVMASTSTQRVVERCTPQLVGDGLYFFNLADLNWDWRLWFKVLKKYPYYLPTFKQGAYGGRTWPIVLRADWLIVALTDTNQYKFSYDLIYGKNAPKTIQEFQRFWKVFDKDAEYFMGMVEGKSGVSKKQTRWIENRPSPRGYYWQTKDVLDLKDPRKEPLKHLDGNFKYDGQEAILGFQKVSIKTKKVGTVQFYLLAGGDDKRVEIAPGDLVEDYTKYRGYAQIRTTGSCIQCHVHGINEPTQNELRELFQIGATLVTPDLNFKDRVELFHLSDTGKEIERNREDYADGLLMINGFTPVENAEAFKKAVDTYDKNVTLEEAAKESGSTVEEFKLAHGLVSVANNMDPRLAALVQGKAIQRDAWERVWVDSQRALKIWRKQ